MGNYSRYPEGTIAIYAREYKRLPQIPELKIYNDSDVMTDYFEEDRAYLDPSNPLYPQAKAAYNQLRIRDLKRYIKNIEKRIAFKSHKIYEADLVRYQTELKQLEETK
jgi:hypothetical protein